MNHYGILKRDSRDGSDIIYRFAEIEFYLYDAKEPDKDIHTYNRDCRCVEWFFHSSGVDIAFETQRKGDELLRFGGILIRSIEIYEQDATGQWKQTGVVGGPKLSMYEIFNHCSEMPDVIALPDTFAKKRNVGKATKRIGIEDDLRQRFFFDDVNWEMPTERIVETKDTEGKYRVVSKKTIKKYDPKVRS